MLHWLEFRHIQGLLWIFFFFPCGPGHANPLGKTYQKWRAGVSMSKCPKKGVSKFTNVFYYFSEVHRFMLAHFHFWASFSRDTHFCPLRQIFCFLYFPEQGWLYTKSRLYKLNLSPSSETPGCNVMLKKGGGRALGEWIRIGQVWHLRVVISACGCKPVCRNCPNDCYY